MGKKTNIRVLFFINGIIPTDEEKKRFEAIASTKKAFRNIQFITPGLSIERCDAVEGLVPKEYKHLPNYAACVAKRETAMSKLAESSSEDIPDDKKQTEEKSQKRTWGK